MLGLAKALHSNGIVVDSNPTGRLAEPLGPNFVAKFPMIFGSKQILKCTAWLFHRHWPKFNREGTKQHKKTTIPN